MLDPWGISTVENAALPTHSLEPRLVPRVRSRAKPDPSRWAQRVRFRPSALRASSIRPCLHQRRWELQLGRGPATRGSLEAQGQYQGAAVQGTWGLGMTPWGARGRTPASLLLSPPQAPPRLLPWRLRHPLGTAAALCRGTCRQLRLGLGLAARFLF